MNDKIRGIINATHQLPSPYKYHLSTFVSLLQKTMSHPRPLSLDHRIFISNNNETNTLDSDRNDLLLGLALRTPATLSLSPTTTTAASIVKHDYGQHHQRQPSLTLSLLFPAATQHQNNMSSNCDDMSSFSNSFVSVKREREDQLDATADNTDVYEYDEDVGNKDGSLCGGNTRRKTKLRLNKQQSALLEDSFKLHTTLNPKQKEALATQLNLRPRQVEVWFQNRRARTKLKQTEVDIEFLKKCCERLAEENEKLQKELQHLKSLNKPQHQPLYMHQLPLPSITTRLSTTANYTQYCPSCHRHHHHQLPPKNTSNNFIISSKKRFIFSPFTKAAC